MENILVGKKINSVMIAEDKMALLFKIDDGEIKVTCDADCCSHTWVEHIEMPAMGMPATVIEVVDIDMPDLGDMDGCEVVAYYGCKLITDKGEMVIDYRNDSNGYYGGDLCWPNDYHYGGVHGQNVSEEIWVDVTEDL